MTSMHNQPPPSTNPASLQDDVRAQPSPDASEGMAPSVKPLPGDVQARLGDGSLWRSLRRRWVLALTVGIALGCAAATAVWILRPAKYTAFALVKIDAERPEVLPRDRVVNDLELYRMTQTALLKSPRVLDAALR